MIKNEHKENDITDESYYEFEIDMNGNNKVHSFYNGGCEW